MTPRQVSQLVSTIIDLSKRVKALEDRAETSPLSESTLPSPVSPVLSEEESEVPQPGEKEPEDLCSKCTDKPVAYTSTQCCKDCHVPAKRNSKK